MKTLALEYRPRRFDEIVGQRHIKPILNAMVSSKNLPPSLIFAGSRGTGKTTTGRILAAALNCHERSACKKCATMCGSCTSPCGVCPSCKSIFDASSLDVLEIDAASNGLVDNIRTLKDILMYGQLGEYRVVLLDEAHSMSKEAFNALLKILEEPPPQTLFVLLTTEPNKVLDTVVSRSMLFEFRRLSNDDIVSRLSYIVEHEKITVDAELLLTIAERVQGGMRDAIMLLDQISRVGITDVAGFNDLFGLHNVSRDIITAALRADYASGFSIIEDQFYRTGDASSLVNDIVVLVRDLLVAKTLGKEDTLASLFSMQKLVAVMKVLWELKTKVRHIDNDQRAAMEMAFAMITHVLGSVESVPTTNGNGHKPAVLTLAQMREMVK